MSGMCGVYNIKEKATETRLRYIGHVKRRDEEEPTTGRRTVGRWKDVLKRDMNKLCLQQEDAMNRNRRKKLTPLADPTTVHRRNKGVCRSPFL